MGQRQREGQVQQQLHHHRHPVVVLHLLIGRAAGAQRDEELGQRDLHHRAGQQRPGVVSQRVRPAAGVVVEVEGEGGAAGCDDLGAPHVGQHQQSQ